MANAVAAFGEAPVYVEIRTSDAAGAAFQTTLISHRYAIAFQPIDVSRAEI